MTVLLFFGCSKVVGKSITTTRGRKKPRVLREEKVGVVRHLRFFQLQIIEKLLANWWQTLRISFSAVSTPKFACKWKILVWKLLKRSTRRTHLCTATQSQIRLNSVKLTFAFLRFLCQISNFYLILHFHSIVHQFWWNCFRISVIYTKEINNIS